MNKAVVWILIIVLVVIPLIIAGLFMWQMAKKKKEHEQTVADADETGANPPAFTPPTGVQMTEFTINQ